MIDASAPIYVEYKNLSNQLDIFEQQKDIIAQAIRSIEGGNHVFIEGSLRDKEDKFFQKENRFLEAKCLQCSGKFADSLSLVGSSVRLLNAKDSSNREISFFVRADNQKDMSWTISLKEVKPLLVKMGESIKVHYVSQSGIEINGYGKSMKSASRGDTIRVELKDWFSKESTKGASKWIDAVVTAPNEVEYVEQ